MSEIPIKVEVKDRLQGSVGGGIWLEFTAIREDTEQKVFVQTLRVEMDVLDDLKHYHGDDIVDELTDELKEDTEERAKRLLNGE